MPYDLIIIGGGPAGLTAARTAAADGLKVVLVEKKRQITEVKRTCAQTFFSPGAELGDRFYAEAVGLKKVRDGHSFCCPDVGLEVPYHGPLSPSYQLVYLSPSGYAVKRYPDDIPRPWATIFSKKALLAGLLRDVDRMGVDMMPGTAAFGVESDSAGVRVFIRTGLKERRLDAKAAIAADGLSSAIVEYLGLNRQRRVIGKLSRGVQWVMEGMSPDIPQEGNPCFMIAVPSLSQGMVMVGPFPDPDRDGLISLIVTSAGEEVFEGLKKLPRYASWFRRAQLVKRTAYVGNPRTAIRRPISGRVLVAGDAAAAFETLVVGALACGYQAAKATLRQLDGKSGYEEYTQWWLKAFHFHKFDYFEKQRESSGIPLVAVCNDEELDYLYSRLSRRRGDPAKLVCEILGMVARERPGLYARLVAG